MSNQIDYTPAFREEPSHGQNEIDALRFTLRRVIEQRDHHKEREQYWELRYAEVTQQLDEMRKVWEGK